MAAISTVGSGNWIADAATVWSSGSAPTNADDVTITNTYTVTLDGSAVAQSVTLDSGGTLQATGGTTWSLTVERGITQNSGGTISFDMSSDVTKTGLVVLNNVRAAAASNYFWLASAGSTCILKGFPKTRWTTLTADVAVSATTATVTIATGWQTGDKLVFATTQTYNATPRVDASTGTNTVSGTSLSNLTAMTYAHASGGYVGNFSSNLVIRPNTAGDATCIRLTHTTRTGFTRTITDVEFNGLASVSSFPGAGVTIYGSGDGNGTDTPYTRFGNNAFWDFRTGLNFRQLNTPIPRDNNIYYSANNGSSVFGAGGSVNNYTGDDTDSVVFRSAGGGIDAANMPGAVITRPKISACSGAGPAPTSVAGITLSSNITITDADVWSNKQAFITATGKCRVSNTRIGTQYAGAATNDIMFYHQGAHDGIFTDSYFQTAGTLHSNITNVLPGYSLAFANKGVDPSVQEVWGFVSGTSPMLSRDNTTYYGASGSSLKVNTSTVTGNVTIPLQVFAPNGKPVAVSGFINRSAGQTVTVTLSGLGITTSTYTCSGANGTWEQFLVGGTNNTGSDGILDVTVTVVSGTSGTVHIDGVSAPTPVATNTGEFGYWYNGTPVPVVAANFVAAVDVWNVLTSTLTLSGSAGKLLVDNLNATVSSRLATSGYTAPPSASTISSTILTDAQTTPIHADIRKVNSYAVDGTGQTGNEWGPV